MRLVSDSFSISGVGVTPLEAFSEFRREVWIMSSLSHPCLCGLVGFCIYPPCIVCEFVDKGDLYSFIHRSPEDPNYIEISSALRVRMALDIALGMRYLHSRDPPIIHRYESERERERGRDGERNSVLYL